jgi:hypothetical protein
MLSSHLKIFSLAKHVVVLRNTPSSNLLRQQTGGRNLLYHIFIAGILNPDKLIFDKLIWGFFVNEIPEVRYKRKI